MNKLFHKHKLLLDENFPQRTVFPRLNSRHTLKHLVADLKTGGISDENVYARAVKIGYLIVTFNRKHFESLAGKSKKTGIISVSTTLTQEQIDKKITSLLARKKIHQLYGHINHISGEN